ncbi:hypothetical protein [Providencia rettgeri]|uniref:hypothetical protein n=1 Tax=Providencia rettgeri TaxID=587 RepID=UPI0015EB2EF3|nr:hypothetical protein [Providencia rettgeri]QLR04084.1 hypothetical protein H0913_14355 [Providencia rettgeri]
MAIFDIEKDELLGLSDVQLEELIARLSEAEVAAHGHSPARVNWSGSINAPDGGIDVHVNVPVKQLTTGFLERPNTILQSKKHSMPKMAITKEMVIGGKLSSTISLLAAQGGSYIIVSLADDCTTPVLNNRIEAMQDAVSRDPNGSNLHLSFYDRSKLTQWVRQHPSVMLWVKRKLGRGYSGWQPYGAWSNPPQGAVDKIIFAQGVKISLPSGKGQNLSIEDAIGPMRDLVRTTNKAIRITGLSGVGKTRIVQALFDETVNTVGTDALDRTIAVYVDTGAKPEPSATVMLERLISENRHSIMILDNCPSDLHADLAKRVSTACDNVKLITIEYDIRDDKPQTTEVIHIETVGPEVAEKLLLRRFPNIGQNNARRIAEFADGNARISLAIAERVEEGESLAQLSDAQLFNRLFDQRNHQNDDLKEQAEILSLVYSFSISDPDVGENELEVLGSLSGYSKNQLFRTVKKLIDRHIVQKRAHWRAILPQAIANRLASSALDSIPTEQLRTIFEFSNNQRLLMSFAHRLGLLHDHPVAIEIVEDWLQPEGLLGKILELDDSQIRMLEYIAPVAPDALLNRIQIVLTSSNFNELTHYAPRRTTTLKLLQALAYEPKNFELCAKLLISIADDEKESSNHDDARQKLTKFFQPYLSGTHASIEQRIKILNDCLISNTITRRSLGLKMLSTALNSGPWSGIGLHEFGAKPRDFGFEPNYDELVEWRHAFINCALQLGISNDLELKNSARQILANQFRGMWYQEAMREILIDAARKLHSFSPWSEGWKAIRSVIYFNYSKSQDSQNLKPIPDSLVALEKELEPNNLISKIITFVLSQGRDYWALDNDFNHNAGDKYTDAQKRLEANAQRLGKIFAISNHKLYELGSNLFSSEWMPYRAAFGKGLAKGTCDQKIHWQNLVDELKKYPEINKDFSVFKGFIEEVDSINRELAQEILDQCAQHSELKKVLVDLHPWKEFTINDFNRCIAILDDSDINPFMYGAILWAAKYADLPRECILDLTSRLLSKPNGDDVVLEGLSMRLHDKDESIDILGAEFRLLGLKAGISRLKRNDNDSGSMSDYNMERVINAALRFDGNEPEKLEWLDTIFDVIDNSYGYLYSFETVIEKTVSLMPEEFLCRIFEGTDRQKQSRLYFIRGNDRNGSVLEKIDKNSLLEWCCFKNDSNIFAAVATGINLWVKDEATSITILSEMATKLLELAPEPKVVLEAFAECTTPSCWSGSLANIMQSKADAISQLITHDRTDISIAAKSVNEKLTHRIENERSHERKDAEEREQRFE